MIVFFTGLLYYFTLDRDHFYRLFSKFPGDLGNTFLIQNTSALFETYINLKFIIPKPRLFFSSLALLIFRPLASITAVILFILFNSLHLLLYILTIIFIYTIKCSLFLRTNSKVSTFFLFLRYKIIPFFSPIISFFTSFFKFLIVFHFLYSKMF